MTSAGARERFRAVWADYGRWEREHPGQDAEQYLADLHEAALFTRRPPFEWAVELLAAVLATPRLDDVRTTSPRYGVRITRPSRCQPHLALWAAVARRFRRFSVVTTNYDLLIERGLRHRPMQRGFGPGCHYGGLARPQLLKGTALPFSTSKPQRIVELEGPVPVCKLHGSLNWAWSGSALELYQDLRPAFRTRGRAAIVPPIPDKDAPTWLRPVWQAAEEELSHAESWVVCGYSLPDYDVAVQEILTRAARSGGRTVLVLDPNSEAVARRYALVAPDARLQCLPGLPAGIEELFPPTTGDPGA